MVFKVVLIKCYSNSSRTFARIQFNTEIKKEFGNVKNKKHKIDLISFNNCHILTLWMEVNIVMEKQYNYCESKKIPMFIRENGKCWFCGKENKDTDSEHLTSCQYCSRSFFK